MIFVRETVISSSMIITIIIIVFIRRKTIQKAVIENCGQDKSGNSTYNCPRNRHKSIKTIYNIKTTNTK